ncbi:FkbM family methyltransferase [Cerasicoccus fimbriatus]|uniref:FkbM family methyltransferase n=1 Tax=Cerasicoccus fimbriatus TaxID=3014554 RepID=UPI0022B5DD8E|nr:FkbM family methyltransferase [Cerasicoccus sp. TK19100]
MIIDGGANIGLATLFLKQRYPQAKVTTIEADPNINEILIKNCNTYDCQNVTHRHGALWDEPGSLSFLSDNADGGAAGDSSDASNEVPALLLSEIIADQHVDFLKLDIEGAEMRVIQEAKHALPQVDRIFIEYHSIKGEEQELGKILKILTESGLRYYVEATCFIPKKPFISEPQDGRFDHQVNIFAWREA